jgi:predicted phosphodiesterase
MATYGLIADIHGNRVALDATLRKLERLGVERILCLGDIVGYHAEPNECIRILKKRAIEAIIGNHDLISIRGLGFENCAKKVVKALKRTRRVLSEDSRAYLAGLPASGVYEQSFAVIHGGVDDVEYYMRTIGDIRTQAERFRARFPGIGVCFFGHVHEQKIYEVHAEKVCEVSIDGDIRLAPDRLYFVNPGSVDATRKSSERRAQCAIYDSGTRRVEMLEVDYDHIRAESLAAKQGYRIGPWMAWIHKWHLVDRDWV